jgi:hypothetical protein
VLGAATRAVDRARNGAGELPLRLGYVSWLPSEAAAIADPRVRVDEWVLPSHTQAARVAEGSLDLAIAWIEEADIVRLNLTEPWNHDRPTSDRLINFQCRRAAGNWSQS